VELVHLRRLEVELVEREREGVGIDAARCLRGIEQVANLLLRKGVTD
jgi:hypothetical protein